MELINSTSLRCFPPEMDWRECIEAAARSGYQGIEVNFDGQFELDCSLSTLQELKSCAQQAGVRIVSVYSRQQWKTPISSRDPEKRRRGIQALERLIEIASCLGAPTILTIPGAVDNSILSPDVEILPYREVYHRVQEVIGDLAKKAESNGVILALENVPNKFLLSPLEFHRFLEELGSPAVGCHFDVANCLYGGGYPEDWIRTLRSWIKAVHLKDYKVSVGSLSGFCDIFEGDVNWKEVCLALREIGYAGALISEVLPSYKYHPEMLWETASRAIQKIIEDIRGINY